MICNACVMARLYVTRTAGSSNSYSQVAWSRHACGSCTV